MYIAYIPISPSPIVNALYLTGGRMMVSIFWLFLETFCVKPIVF
jgi:hypothetical protein